MRTRSLGQRRNRAQLPAEPYETGAVLPHERTHELIREERLRLLRATHVQPEPILLLADRTVETPDTVAGRIRKALPFAPADRIVVAPDCGLKYLPREVAFGKMRAMVEGAGIVRRELAA